MSVTEDQVAKGAREREAARYLAHTIRAEWNESAARWIKEHGVGVGERTPRTFEKLVEAYRCSQ